MTTKELHNKLTPIFNKGPDFDIPPPSNSAGWSDSEPEESEEESDNESEDEPEDDPEDDSDSEESDKKDIESIDTELTIVTRQNKGKKKITVLIGLDDTVAKKLLTMLQRQLSCGGAIIDSEYNGIKQNVLQLNGDHITNKVQFDKMKNCITMFTTQKIKVVSY
jgi:translation initiation factor 1 (eIF-1/SUI1)